MTSEAEFNEFLRRVATLCNTSVRVENDARNLVAFLRAAHGRIAELERENEQLRAAVLRQVPCMECRDIQGKDGTRHFKGCPKRVEKEENKPAPVCSTCSDSHQVVKMVDGIEFFAPCQRCPHPCRFCRGPRDGALGAFCAVTPCDCKCHRRGSHLVDGEFQSDKYPTTPRGKVPLSVKDKEAQDLLWEYAERHRSVDQQFSDDLQTALTNAGYSATLFQTMRGRITKWGHEVQEKVEAQARGTCTVSTDVDENCGKPAVVQLASISVTVHERCEGHVPKKGRKKA